MDTRKFKQLLEEEYQRVLSREQRNREDIVEATDPLGHRLFDEGEMANSNHCLAINTRVCESSSEILKKIKEASERINRGTFGKCTNPLDNPKCEITISEQRLEAVPWQDVCIRCQEAIEQLTRTFQSAYGVQVDGFEEFEEDEEEKQLLKVAR